MTDETILDLDSAADILGVPTDRVRVMVDEGLLTPLDDGTDPRFRETEVRALRKLGG